MRSPSGTTNDGVRMDQHPDWMRLLFDAIQIMHFNATGAQDFRSLVVRARSIAPPNVRATLDVILSQFRGMTRSAAKIALKAFLRQQLGDYLYKMEDQRLKALLVRRPRRTKKEMISDGEFQRDSQRYPRRRRSPANRQPQISQMQESMCQFPRAEHFSAECNQSYLPPMKEVLTELVDTIMEKRWKLCFGDLNCDVFGVRIRTEADAAQEARGQSQDNHDNEQIRRIMPIKGQLADDHDQQQIRRMVPVKGQLPDDHDHQQNIRHMLPIKGQLPDDHHDQQNVRPMMPVKGEPTEQDSVITRQPPAEANDQQHDPPDEKDRDAPGEHTDPPAYQQQDQHQDPQQEQEQDQEQRQQEKPQEEQHQEQQPPAEQQGQEEKAPSAVEGAKPESKPEASTALVPKLESSTTSMSKPESVNVLDGATIFLVTSSGQKHAVDFDVAQGVMRWVVRPLPVEYARTYVQLIQTAEIDNKMLTALSQHIHQGGRIFVLAVGDDRECRLVGEVDEIEDVTAGGMAVKAGEELLQEEAGKRLHKVLSPKCLHPGLSHGTPLSTVTITSDKIHQTQWCPNCCYTHASARMVFKELKDEGVALYESIMNPAVHPAPKRPRGVAFMQANFPQPRQIHDHHQDHHHHQDHRRRHQSHHSHDSHQGGASVSRPFPLPRQRHRAGGTVRRPPRSRAASSWQYYVPQRVQVKQDPATFNHAKRAKLPPTERTPAVKSEPGIKREPTEEEEINQEISKIFAGAGQDQQIVIKRELPSGV